MIWNCAFSDKIYCDICGKLIQEDKRLFGFQPRSQGSTKITCYDCRVSILDSDFAFTQFAWDIPAIRL